MSPRGRADRRDRGAAAYAFADGSPSGGGPGSAGFCAANVVTSPQCAPTNVCTCAGHRPEPRGESRRAAPVGVRAVQTFVRRALSDDVRRAEASRAAAARLPSAKAYAAAAAVAAIRATAGLIPRPPCLPRR